MRVMRSKSGSWEFSEGGTLLAWTNGDIREGKYVYFWAWADPSGDEEDSIWYRVYPDGGPPGDWVEMLPAERVYAKTGYEPEEHDEDDEDQIVGGAEVLPAGLYRLDLQTVLDGEPLRLEGITFRVAGRDDPTSGWQIK